MPFAVRLAVPLAALVALGLGLSSCSGGSGGSRASSRADHHTTSSSNRSSSSSVSSVAGPTSSSPGAPGSSGTSGSWTTYGGSFARTSFDGSDPARTKSPSEAWKSEALDGDVYGEALVYHGDVFVATENDTVYGFSQSTGSPLWPPDHVATPAQSDALPCGDINPTVGITSTMVIDPSTGVLFASAETSSSGSASSASSVHHLLYAIQSSTGKVLWSRDIDQSWVAADQLQRLGLAISDGNVLVGFGGNYGDCGQ
ncbi:MAG: PQQ-binding-like beta-propeller repeat protein, partial [Acidimicrobiales bacterium]